ncbi:Hypothetical predicted protein, partial [Olea europaea subsp. europaea]
MDTLQTTNYINLNLEVEPSRSWPTMHLQMGGSGVPGLNISPDQIRQLIALLQCQNPTPPSSNSENQ